MAVVLQWNYDLQAFKETIKNVVCAVYSAPAGIVVGTVSYTYSHQQSLTVTYFGSCTHCHNYYSRLSILASTSTRIQS